MDFFDEESRPRFLLQSRSVPKPTPQIETIDNPLLNIPKNLTYQNDQDSKQENPIKILTHPDGVVNQSVEIGKKIDGNENENVNVSVFEEQDWTENDLEVLKKQILKNPVGMSGRWEAVVEAFSGRHKVESVVKMTKSLGERRTGDSDSFLRFLKDRKTVNKRADEVIENERGNVSNNGGGGGDGSWNSGEDIVLLNALKAFQKEVPIRWEKITNAVPGRSKAACMKRVTDLKKEFRSSKASSGP